MAGIKYAGGSDYFRLVMPFRHLKDRGFDVSCMSITDLTPDIVAQFDVVVMPRLESLRPELIDQDFQSFRVGHCNTVIYECDDDGFHLDPRLRRSDGTYELKSAERQEATRATIRRCDAVQVSTPHLREQFFDLNSTIVVLPNMTDPTMWQWARRPKDDQVIIGIQGSPSHIFDWRILETVVTVIADRYPQVIFHVQGYCPSYLASLPLGDRIKFRGWENPETFARTLSLADIGVAPLDDTLFNRSKSPQKWLDFSSAGIPIVASPTVYTDYIKHGKTGFIARTEEEWVTFIGLLIENSFKRKSMGQAARRDVMEHHNVMQQKCILPWMKFYRREWEKSKARARAA